jgi:hypothetical protein
MTRMNLKISSFMILILMTSLITGCSTTVPKSALAMNPQTLEMRQLQTRKYATRDEAKILSASAGLLQDLGFSIDNSETKVGLIAASKDRDATDGGQVVGAVLMAALFGVSTPIDDVQKIRVAVVTNYAGNSMSVRVTFQRVVWNTQGQISRLEKLEDPEMYEEFFLKLSKSIFLEAQEI